MFKNGTVPFLGDYIDIQGQAFVRKGSGWAFNTDLSPAPVFHAVWTTNQDVRAPRSGDWTRYTPLPLPGQAVSVFDPAAGTPPFCSDPAQSGHEATRNQNVYTSRITEGLLVTAPQNAKPLSPTETRSFVVVAQNTTRYRKALRFSVSGIDTTLYGSCAGTETSCASFQKDALVQSLDVVVLPGSSVSRSLFVRSPSASTSLVVNVAEVLESGSCSLAAGNCSLARPGLSGFVTLNPPGTTPSLVAPDGTAGIGSTGEIVLYANVSTANVSTANVSTANVSTANISTANVSTANVSTANVSTANVSTANVTTANISTANVSTANVSTANVSTANVSTASLATANVSTANVSTANVTTAPISDLNYEVTNPGNTTTSYSVQVVRCPDASCAVTTPLQLIVTKFYTVPAAIDCRLVAEPRSILVANGGFVEAAVVSSGALVDPKVREGATTNATVVLAPGERAQITLRGQVSLGEMAIIGSRLAPAVVPHATPIGGTTGTQTYATAGAVPSPVTTTLTSGPEGFVATVSPATAGGPVPTGTVTFLLNGSTILATVPLVEGQATLAVTLAPGDQISGYYGGDARYAGSAGTLAAARTVTGTFQTTWWLDDGTRLTRPAPPPAGTVVSALVATGIGYDAYPGSFDAASGQLSIPSVPSVPYLLVVDERPAGGRYYAVQHVASTIDLTEQRAGRPDAVVATRLGTDVTYSLTGLVPWTPGTPLVEIGDYVGVFGSRVIEYPIGLGDIDLAAGATTANVVAQWGGVNQGTLPDTAAGDVVTLNQMAKSTIPGGQPGAGLSYWSASRFARLGELFIADGIPSTITATLEAAPASGSVAVDVASADFQSYLSELGPGASWTSVDVYVMAAPHTLEFPAPWAEGVPDVFWMTLPPGTPNTNLGTFSFGRGLDPMWKEFLEVGGGGWVPVLASGASQPAQVSSSVWSVLPLEQATGTLAPRLGPPRAPTLDGLSLSTPRVGVGTTPTIGWTAPSLGSPTSYTVELREVRSTFGGRTGTGIVGYFSLFGAATQSLRLPPGILVPGREYVAVIRARSGPWDVVDAPAGRRGASTRAGYPVHNSSTVSAKFSP